MEHTSETHDRQNDRLSSASNGHRPPIDRSGPSTAGRRVTVPEAAEILGTTTDAVRSRIRRGKLQREEGEDGTVYVILEGSVPPRDSDGRQTVGGGHKTVEDRRETATSTVEDSLVDVLSDQVSYLREQLDKEREANRENRRLLAAALERIPELEAPREAAPETRNAPETASPRSDRGTAPEGSEDPTERRSWWRQFFGIE
jgi:hypothetical protein